MHSPVVSLIPHNGRDQWLAAQGPALTHNDARDSIASRGSALNLWIQDSPVAATHLFLLKDKG